MPTIVRLPAKGGTPIAEEPFWLGVGAQSEVLELRDAGAHDARGNITGEIKHGVVRATRPREETRIGRVSRNEAFDEFRADFVVGLPDGRPECSDDTATIRPHLPHPPHPSFNDPP